MMKNIVRATPADAEAIGRFQTMCWEQTYRGVVPDEFLDATTVAARARRWAERIEAASRVVVLARSESGTLLGVASTARAAPVADGLPSLELCTIYVDQGSHGTGIAADLLDAAIGSEDAHLLVFSFNERAQRFYARHGFSPSGLHQTDPGTGLEEQQWIRRTP